MRLPAKGGESAPSVVIDKELKDGNLYCLYDEGFNPKFFVSNAEAMCVWAIKVDPSNLATIESEYGPNNDTIEISIKDNINTLTTLTISISYEGNSSMVANTAIVLPRKANKAGEITIDGLLDDTTYCANLEYRAWVSEDPGYKKDGTNTYGTSNYPNANLSYTWTLRTGSNILQTFPSKDPEKMYEWKYSVPTNATSWRIQPHTCDQIADPAPTAATEEKIHNIIPRKLATTDELSVIAIMWKDGEWDTTENADYQNACTWYSEKFNNAANTNSESRLEGENFNGYVYLQAKPYQPEERSFRHYQYEWIFDTAALYLDTIRMAQSANMRDNGFGANKGRACFKVKERPEGTSTEIKVSYKLHCQPCDSLAKLQSKSYVYVSDASQTITLTRIDSLVDKKIDYSIDIRDGYDNPMLSEADIPYFCGLTQYKFCNETKGEGNQTKYVWYLGTPPGADKGWEGDGGGGCLESTSPAVPEQSGKIGDTIFLMVYPANYCFVNGNDTSRNAKYLYGFLRSTPRAPKIIDPLTKKTYNGYTKAAIEEMSGGGMGGGAGAFPGGGGMEQEESISWPTDGVPFPLLVCNQRQNVGLTTSFWLITTGNKIKPNSRPEIGESGFKIEFPGITQEEVEEALTSSYRIDSYKEREESDTNVLVFTIDINKRKALEGKLGFAQIGMSVKAANECGTGDALYFPINIIDTISVIGHVYDKIRNDADYDTVASLCEGEIITIANDTKTKTDTYITDETDPAQNTDRIEYQWYLPDTWRFATGTPASELETLVQLGRQDGSVRLAIKNRCGEGKPHSGDYIDVNPYTRVAIKVVNGTYAIDPAYDPNDKSPEVQKVFANDPFLLLPCRGSEIMYAGDTSERTDRYRWEFPDDWEVITNGSGYNGTATPVPNHPNWAYTSHSGITTTFHDMRVRVKVGGDTGNIYVVGETEACNFTFDNYKPDMTKDPVWYGHNRDSLRAVVRPFTGKPMPTEPWPDSICVRICNQEQECTPNEMMIAVIPDITQDSLTRAQTYFEWVFPDDYNAIQQSSEGERNDMALFTVPDEVGRIDTIKVYSHRLDCDDYNQGDSLIWIFKLTDTIPFVQHRILNDARNAGSIINTKPCEGDTVFYRVLPEQKYLDSVWFTWNGGNELIDKEQGLIDTTGWRVLNPIGHYADTLKMIVGRSKLELGSQAVSSCGMASLFITVFEPVSLVRDTVHLVQGRDLLCENEKALFEWDSVKYATQYEWFYPWGNKHDTLGQDKKMFYREFSRRTAFDTGYIYVRPGNVCGWGPYSDSVKVGQVIKHLGVPAISPELTALHDTVYDTVCLRTSLHDYTANYVDQDYPDGLAWQYGWFGLAADAQDTLQMKEADSSRFHFVPMANFQDRYIGVAVRHKACTLWGDTLILRVHPADTVAIDDAALADRLSDQKRDDKTVMTRPCGSDTAEWHFNSVFGDEKVQYRFVWWDSEKKERARYHDEDGVMVQEGVKGNDNFKWLNPKEESDLDDAWYSGDEDFLQVSIPNNQILYLSVDIKNRCGISHLPALDIRTVVSISDSAYGLRAVYGLHDLGQVCEGDSLTLRVDSSVNIGGFIWHYPWGKTVDTVKVGTQVVRTFNTTEYKEGDIYVVPYNGCGNAKESDTVKIEEVLHIPARAVPVDFDLTYNAAKNPVAIDTLCMRSLQILHVHSESWDNGGEYEMQWNKIQGRENGFFRYNSFDSCGLIQNDVNDETFVLEFSSRVKGCHRYSDTLQIRVFPMDTLTFVMAKDEDAEDESWGSRFEVVLPEIVLKYADQSSHIDLNPCSESEQKYTIAKNIHWSISSDDSSYFSWKTIGEASSTIPDADNNNSLGGTDWRYWAALPDEAIGGPYRDLPLIVGEKDTLQLYVNLRNLCGTSRSPALTLVPKPKVRQVPLIQTPDPLCLDKAIGFDCQMVEYAEAYCWEFPWEPGRDTTEVFHVDIPKISDTNGQIIVYAFNGCGNGPADTLDVMVIHTPKAPRPAWNPQEEYSYDNDTVVDVTCLYGSGFLKVQQDSTDAPGVQFRYVLLRGETIDITQDGNITPKPTASVDSSVLLAVYGFYEYCGGSGDTLFIRLGYEDTLPSEALGRILINPSTLEQEPKPCPGEEIELSVEHNIAVAYKWTLPDTWKFKEGSDSTASTVSVVVGTENGQVGVVPATSHSELGCGSLAGNPIYSVSFEPRQPPLTPEFAENFNDYPCVGSTVTYTLEAGSATNIKAYRWEFPAGWRIDTANVAITSLGSCSVLVGKDSGEVRVYAMDSCGESLLPGTLTAKSVYPVDTARLQIIGDNNVCLDSLVTLQVVALNQYTDSSDYERNLDFGIEIVSVEGIYITIRCHTQDTARLTFSPINIAGCPDNIKETVHLIIADTIPEIPGVIDGPESVCADNAYMFTFHADPEQIALLDNKDIRYQWQVPAGWHIDSTVNNDTVLYAYFDAMDLNDEESFLTDTIFCYPLSGCGKASPTSFVIRIQPQDEFTDSIEVERLDPCVGTELKAWLRDSASYRLDTIRFFWNTPDGWTRLDGDSLPKTSYLVQYDTASYIQVRYQRRGSCGKSKTLSLRVNVKDSASKACLDGLTYPCYTRPVFELAIVPDPEHIDSVKWFYDDNLRDRATVHTREGSYMTGDSLAVDNSISSRIPFSVQVRSFNECGTRDTVFTIRPVTEISEFTNEIQVPRYCLFDTGYVYIDLTDEQRYQGMVFEWSLIPDSVYLPLHDFVVGDTAAVLQYLAGSVVDKLKVMLRVGNDCSPLSDSLVSPQILEIPKPFVYEIVAGYDNSYGTVYGTDSLPLSVERTTVGRIDDYNYIWQPENRLYPLTDSVVTRRYAKTLLQENEIFYVDSRQKAGEDQESLPFYRQDRLCHASDTIWIRTDSILQVYIEGRETACVETEQDLNVILWGGNVDRMRVDTTDGKNRYSHHIEWFRWEDSLWVEIEDSRDKLMLTVMREKAGDYLYRLVVRDSVVLKASGAEEVFSRSDTVDIVMSVYGYPVIRFTNVSADPIQVPLGSSIEVQTEVYDGTGEFVYSWTSAPDTALILPGYDSLLDVMTHSIYQSSELRFVVWDTLSGCVSSDTIHINLGKGSNIPNAFTPNGDGKNDIFLKGVAELTIFTRWGEEIYRTTQGEGWDGTHKNKKVKPGDYMYVAVVRENGKDIVLKGVVTVLTVD
ncbi:MAG: gliding motility-associated C-terminal domain-containing protein [Lentimicrobiaceae bacterium]|nr:gliding motility-associated C-terminal domain-containing protein [Lentimicrobiaceae bacterium]